MSALRAGPGAVLDPAQIGARANQPFCEQEARDQLVIVTWGAHGDGERLARDADFERLLHRELVWVSLEYSARPRAPSTHRGDLNAGREFGAHGDTRSSIALVG